MTDEEVDKLVEEWVNENYPYKLECRSGDPIGNISAKIATKVNNFTIQNIFKAGYKAATKAYPDKMIVIPMDAYVAIDDYYCVPFSKLVEARKTTQWIPVSERLPENKQQIIVYVPTMPWTDSCQMAICRFQRGKTKEEVSNTKIHCGNDEVGNNLKPYYWSYGTGGFFGQEVSHWMPLPNPPKPLENKK